MQKCSFSFEALFEPFLRGNILTFVSFLDVIISFASKSATDSCALSELLVLEAQFHIVHHLLDKPGSLHCLATKT